MSLPTRTLDRNEGVYLTVQDVADLLKMHPRTVLRYLIAQKLPGKKIGTRWICRRDVIDKFMS